MAAEHVLAYARAHRDALAGAFVFAAPVETDAGDPASQLLALLGRTP